MKCPACEHDLIVEILKGQEVDRCVHCNGIYFDKGELDSVLTIVELYNTAELEETDIDLVPADERDRKLVCPRDGHAMDEHQIGGIVFDKCLHCEGIWLDGGEISALKMLENHIRQNLSLYLRLGQ